VGALRARPAGRRRRRHAELLIMCGIAGIVSLDERPVALADLRRMCGAMVHRGPDDEGFYVARSAGLAMRRLSIIDLAGGRQPVHNEDRSVWAVLNGEIYNFQELRRGLLARGHVFTTATDTEVIVHLYEEKGPRCLESLRGMFGLAVWDERARSLLLARDRVGIKPVYYWQDAGRLAFASEVKALLELPEVERTLNWRALGHLLAFLTTPHTESIVEGVRKLEPGTYLLAGPDGIRHSRYWELRWQPDAARGERETVEALREQLDESVRLHMISDVPVGAFLSGGVDSSAVVAAMARQSARPVKTFSIGFVEEDYSELRHARAVARALGTEHHERVLQPDVVSVLDDLVWHLDEPFGDPSAIPTYMVSQMAAEHVTVVLSGDGGDELFAGYDRYRVEERERRYDRLPRTLRRAAGAVASRAPRGMKGRNFLRHLALDGHRRYLDAASFFGREEQRELLQPEAFARVSAADPWSDAAAYMDGLGGDWLSTLQQLDVRGYLPLDILTKVDRMSMAHSIEARVPLLDHVLMEFAATIPPGLRLRQGAGKYVFKQALRGVLPAAILDRPKQGFAIPLGRWFRGGLSSLVRDLLLSRRSRERGVIQPRAVEALLRRNEAGRDQSFQLWTLISFELWARHFLDGAARPAREWNGAPLVVGPAAPAAMVCA
jgi:asparagine synthase (glutamine-hydrolysing)